MASGSSNALDIEEIKTWSVNALKAFLHIRGKITDGTFDELVARAFVTSSENTDIDPELEHEERAVLSEYVSKLNMNGTVLPDPLLLKSDWLGEKNGIIKWPSLIYKNIADYMSLLGPEFISQLEREYKLGKAYRYFAADFVREVYYHDISKESAYCFLRTRVVPSQRTSSKPYFVWACITKNIEEYPGGKVIATYCQCTAGLKGTCNHVVALLFRIDNAVITGLTNPSKTSRLCTWNIPSGIKVNVQPTEVSKMVFKQSHYTSVNERDYEQEKEAFLSFSPTLNDSHFNELNDTDTMRANLYTAIKNDVTNSRFAELMEQKPLNRPEKETLDLPGTLMDKVETYYFDRNLSIEENVKIFTKTLTISEQQIIDVKKLTSKQNINTEWGHYRSGRLTASNFHKICTRVETLKKNPEKNAKALIDSTIGNSKRIQTKQMKHGKALEPHAIRKYTYVVTKGRKHKNFKVKEIGLVIKKEYPFIGASPDMEISCDCCGTGVGEIKCPYSVIDQIPSENNLPYLVKTIQEDGDEIIQLKKNHAYYYQIQGQMAITKTSYCDFFVYSMHGYHLERIYFDLALWTNILEKLKWFWFKFVAAALLEREQNYPTTNKLSSNVTNTLAHTTQNEQDIDFDLNVNPIKVSKKVTKISTDKKTSNKLISDIVTSSIATHTTTKPINTKYMNTTNTINNLVTPVGDKKNSSKLKRIILTPSIATQKTQNDDNINTKSAIDTHVDKKTSNKLKRKIVSSTIATHAKPKTSNNDQLKATNVIVTYDDKKLLSKNRNDKKNRIVENKSKFYCGVCKKELPENPACFEEESIGCETCPLWYHFTCVGIKKNQRKKKSKDLWVCLDCKK